jgi:hypothetical protein
MEAFLSPYSSPVGAEGAAVPLNGSHLLCGDCLYAYCTDASVEFRRLSHDQHAEAIACETA